MIDCNLGKIGKTDPPRCPHLQKFVTLSFLHLVSNGLNGVNIN